jgi:hypothetical protein
MALAILVMGLLAKPSLAQSYPPAWNTKSAYAVGDQVQLNGNIYRAIKAVTPNLSPAVYFNYWELNYVRSNTTLLIGDQEQFSTLLNAWDYVLEARVADGVYLHLSIVTAHGGFNETFSAPFSLDHSSGARISILGDNASKINLSFPGSNCFTIDSGHTFGTLSNMTLNQPELATNSGIYCSQNSCINLVSGITFYSCGWGIFADSGGQVNCANNLNVLGFNLGQVIAQYGAQVTIAPGYNMVGTNGPQETSCKTFEAAYGGVIKAEGGTFGDTQYGAFATEGGVIDVNGSTPQFCQPGVLATYKGHISAENCTFNDNGAEDIVAFKGGTVDASNSTYTYESSNGSADGSYIFN